MVALDAVARPTSSLGLRCGFPSWINRPDRIGPCLISFVVRLPFFPPHQDFIEVESTLRQGLLGASFVEGVKNDYHTFAPVYLLSASAWGMSVVVADTFVSAFCRGPAIGSLGSCVFLAGDSAHQFPPAGGFGMNTGVQDTHDLGWKLPYCLHGAALSNLSRSYEVIGGQSQFQTLCSAWITGTILRSFQKP